MQTAEILEEPVLHEDSAVDIVGDLSHALQYELRHYGSSFYFGKTYYDTFDPGLRLEGVGKVKLPLVAKEAKRIKAECRQAPFGMGTETVVDTSVRHTWEMDASKVQFEYPGWAKFVEKVAADVCNALGVARWRVTPKCEPYKLLLYEQGSHFLPHRDTEKSDGMFATMIILLPSPFQGGSAQLSFGGVDATLDYANESAHSISAIAWYTDVTHQILPVTSGHRLALSYNLIHPTTSIRPSLPTASGPLDQISHTLRSWNAQGYRGTQKIIFLLDHEYSQANLSWSALKGADAHRFGVLGQVAEEFGFQIGFAHVESELEVSTKRRERSYEEDEEDEEDAHSYDYSEEEGSVAQREVSFTNFVDSDGDLIDKNPRFDDSTEHIPSEIVEALEDRYPDGETREPYTGNDGGYINRWYRSTVLVIWPRIRDPEIRCTEGGYGSGIVKALKTSASTTSHPTELSFIEYLLYSPKKDDVSHAEAFQTVCTVSLRWKDLVTWRRTSEEALKGGSSIELLGNDLIANLLEVFGERDILPTVELMLKKDSHNQAPMSLLRHLSTRCGDRVELGEWIGGQRLALLNSLRPMVKDDVTLLMETFRANGGVTLLEKTILPQVIANETSVHQFAIASAIHAERNREDGMLRTPEDLDAAKRVATDLIAHSIGRADYFALVPTTRWGYSWEQSVLLPSPALAMLSIKTCISTGNEALVERIVDRLLDRTGVLDKTFITRVTSFFLPLAPFTEELLASRPQDAPPIPALERLFDTTVQTFSDKISTVDPTTQGIAMLLQAVALSGQNGGQSLLESVLPCWKKMTRETSLQKHFIQGLYQHRDKIILPRGSRQTIPEIIAGLLDSMLASTLDIKQYMVLDCVEAALDVGRPESCDGLLAGLFQPPIFTQELFTAVLYPLVAAISALLAQRSVSPTTPPFGSFFKRAVLHWAASVLAPNPSKTALQLSQLTMLHCKERCDMCSEVVSFMRETYSQTHRLKSIGVGGIDHVIRNQLEPSGAGECATWEKISMGGISLEIRKNNQFLRDSWELNRTVDLSNLRGISGDDQVLETVLGADAYEKLLRQLGMLEINPGTRPVATAASPVPNTAPGPSNTGPAMDHPTSPSRPETPPNSHS